MKLDIQGTAGGIIQECRQRQPYRWRQRQINRERGEIIIRNGQLERGEMQRKNFSVKYSSPQYHRSSFAPGHNKLCPATVVTGQTDITNQSMLSPL